MLKFLGTIKRLAEMRNLSEEFYSHYKLDQKSQEKMSAWMVRNHIPNPVPAHELHCTIIFSKIDPKDYTASSSPIDIDLSLGEFDNLGPVDNPKATVIKLPETAALTQRYNLVRSKGAISDYPTYIPHITLSYTPFNYSFLTLPQFTITLEREYLKYS